MFHCVHSSAVGSSTGALVLVLLQGVCVWGDEPDETVSAVVGGTVVLSSGYQREDVRSAEWTFTDLIIADYAESKIKVDYIPEFKGRLEMNPNNFNLTVSKLTKKDSGEFQFLGTSTIGEQLKTKTFLLQVYDSTLTMTMNVAKTVTLLQLNNSCMVSLLCNASGGPGVNFSWSGYRTGSGANLRFPLSPADGRVKLTCTAVRDQTTNQTKVTLKCDNKTLNDSREPDVINPTPCTESSWYLCFVVIPAAGGGLVLIILSTVVGVCCHRRRAAKASEQDTVYADVNPDQKPTPRRSLSGSNEMSIYETVNERAVGIQSNPQTLYDKINFTRPGGKGDVCTRATQIQSNPQTLYDRINFTRPGGKGDVCTTLSSPYQEVL